MTSHPFLFSAEMVRALLRGSKTMTRRIISRRNSLIDGLPAIKKLWDNLDFSKATIDPGPSPAGNPGPYLKVPRDEDGKDTFIHRVYPRYQVGDTIWGRETFAPCISGPIEPGNILYRADNKQLYDRLTWTPSIFMPKWACRLNLEILEVRPERVQDISEEDAEAEGVQVIPGSTWCYIGEKEMRPHTHRSMFQGLWNSLHSEHGKRWEDNPLVWKIRFKRL